MKRPSFDVKGFIVRYLLLILSASFNLGIFYAVFTPLTVYPVYWITKIFFDSFLIGTTIVIQESIPIELIESCIAGSAYFLLLILNMSVPGINTKRRIKMVLLSFLALLALNILRIVILIIVYMFGASFFDVTHKVFWYALSTLFVVGIWFAEVKIFKIKEIPVYSDVKSLLESAKKIKKSKSGKKH